MGDIDGRAMTVLLLEQNIHNARSVGSRGYVVETGRIVAAKPAEELRSDPELLRAYLGR